MSERALAACTQSGNCPGVAVLDDGGVAVTGVLPGGAEATVVLPADVFDRAARQWLAGRHDPWRRMLPRLLVCAAAGVAVTYAVMGLGASSLAGHLIGLGLTLAAAAVVGWREAGRDG